MHIYKSKKIIIFITFGLILVAGILTKQKFALMIPLFVSILVAAFSAEANRIAFLFGGINSCIYAVVYIHLGLYSTAASSLLFSCPLSIATYLNWKKRAYKSSAIFKKLSVRMRIFSVISFLLIFIAVFLLNRASGSAYAILDTASSIVGIYTTVFCLFTYIEYSYLCILSNILSIALNIQVTLSNSAHSTYLIYSLYCLYCGIIAFFNVQKIYKKQQEDKLSEMPNNITSAKMV